MSEFLVRNKVAKYLLLNQDIANLEAQKRAVKAELEPYLREAPLNTRGSHVIDFTDSLEIAGTKYKGLQKVRKESKVLNEERVKDWLSTKQNSDDEDDIFWDDLISNSEIYTVITHINQDVLWDWFVQDYITDDELASFFDVSESFAFMPTKE